MNTLWRDIQYKMLKSDSRINLLIGINVIVFVLINIPTVGAFIKEYLVLNPAWQIVLRHAWTPITYMFLHEGFFQLLFDMLWLYWMGKVFEEYLNHKRLLGVYLLGGLAGSGLAILILNLSPFASVNLPFMGVTGASISVMTIIVATTTLLPEHEIQLIIIGRVRLKWVCVFYLVLALLGAKNNLGLEAGYIGGALFGFVYIKQLQKGNDWIGSIVKLFAPKPKLKVVAFEKNAQKKSSSSPRQEDIDRILDKISVSGYDSLNKQEKDTLFRASNEG